MPTLLILGGYGGAGLPIARLLTQQTTSNVILAGRHVDRAEEAARQLNRTFGTNRVSACFADAAHPDTLRQALAGVDLLIVASTTTDYVKQVAEAALEAGVDYLDIHYPPQVVATLQTLAPKIEAAGRCFVTQGGFHPGLLAPLIRSAAPEFDRYDIAQVGMLMNIVGYESLDSLDELVQSFAHYDAEVFTHGMWKKASYALQKKFDFGESLGKKTCVPLSFPEIKPLPAELQVQELGTYVAGFNSFLDYVLTPFIIMTSGLKSAWLNRLWSKMMRWGLDTFSKPPFGIWLQLEAMGTLQQQPKTVHIQLHHEDAYAMTATPTVAFLFQYLDGSFRQNGLSLMGLAADPHRLLHDVERLGTQVIRYVI